MCLCGCGESRSVSAERWCRADRGVGRGTAGRHEAPGTRTSPRTAPEDPEGPADATGCPPGPAHAVPGAANMVSPTRWRATVSKARGEEHPDPVPGFTGGGSPSGRALFREAGGLPRPWLSVVTAAAPVQAVGRAAMRCGRPRQTVRGRLWLPSAKAAPCPIRSREKTAGAVIARLGCQAAFRVCARVLLIGSTASASAGRASTAAPGEL